MTRHANYIPPPGVKVHGLTKAPEYFVWAQMIQRCHNPENKQYRYYGGRGIRVCDRWRKSFASFIADMGRRPPGGFSIDRIDNNGNYEPKNCRWVDWKTQINNRPNKRPDCCGDLCHLSKLKTADVIGILASTSATTSELALKYRVGLNAIWSIRRRRTWKHISITPQPTGEGQEEK